MATKRKPKSKHKPKGRKTLYSEQKAILAKNLIDLWGSTDKEIAQVYGINPATMCEWKGRYPEFSKLLKDSRENAIEAVELSLYRSAIGYTHIEEKIFVNKYGTVKRVPVIKHYAPNSAAMSLFLRSQKPERYRENFGVTFGGAVTPNATPAKDFKEFCARAGYPTPFPVQEDMRAFGLDLVETRLLLGARNYGKTDYVTSMGVAYAIFLDYFAALATVGTKDARAPKDTNLIVTKSKERNSAILDEISKALRANGVELEQENSTLIRVKGLHGKDPSVGAVTIGAKSVRGRHPKRIIMDDPVTEDDDSAATRKKVQKLFNELMKLCSNILVIGQPVHKFDLYETLRPLIKKMEVTHGTIPELDHDLAAQRAAGVSEESIQASYFLKVISESGFPLENVKMLDVFPTGDTAAAFIDPSFTGGDYTALTIYKAHFDGVAVYGKLYKRAWYDCIDDIAKELKAHHVARLGFETNNLGEQPLSMLRDVLPGIGVSGKHSSTNKHSRILQAGAYAGNIHLAKTSDKLYIDQVRKYEYGADFDDAPDCLSTGLEWIGLIRGKTKKA